ncbi:MAG: DUF86 domain-containing protein [Proteobacteria bacterium]|nr:DUF86 domain-containing protein [Pseudomonadota bacterium]
MAARRIGDRLRHMLQAVNAIERLAAGKTLKDFGADPDLAAAVERYLERLSEASRHIPQDLKQKHPEIDWRGVADIGNVLRHAYDQVSDRRVWEAVTDDLPPLKAAIEAMIVEVEREDDG